MESLDDVFKIIEKGVSMASVDLKDAFFTVPVHKLNQKCFMFEWIQKFCKSVGMPNGYSDAMRIFTNILKPVYGHLRQEGHLSVIFVADSYLQRDTEQECMNNIKATVDLLLNLRVHSTWKEICFQTISKNFRISWIYYWLQLYHYWN